MDDDVPAPWGSAQSTQPGPTRSPSGRGGGHRTAILAVAGVLVVALVAVGVVLLATRGGSTDPTAAGSSSTNAPSTNAPSTDAPSTDAPSTRAPSTRAPSTRAPSTSASRTTSAATSPAAAPTGTLALGSVAPVGDYTVAVTAVELDADAAMSAQSSGNPAPANGRYVLVTVAATYTGSATGTPYADLFVTLQGGNGTHFDDTACLAVAPDDLSTGDPLTTGRTATGTFCLDVDPAALPGSTVTIAGGISAAGPVWTTGG